MKRLKKYLICAYLSLSGSGAKNGKFLKKHHIFKSVGENLFWRTRIVPPKPQLISIGSNVKIATEVYFCNSDVLHLLFNDMCGGGGGISIIRPKSTLETMYL